MDERQLVYAAAIEKAGSLRQAARELDREYSTLARSLKRLEEELGSPLFRRGINGSLFLIKKRQATIDRTTGTRVFRLLP